MVRPYYPPEFADNSDDPKRVATVLRRLITESGEENLRVASGFFDPRVWASLGDALGNVKEFRLLLGKPPDILALTRAGSPDSFSQSFVRDVAAEAVQEFVEGRLSDQLGDTPLTSENQSDLDGIAHWLGSPGVAVKLWNSGFLHAKAYVGSHHAIVGSSNFTDAGLNHNRELNLVSRAESQVAALQQWFDSYWTSDKAVDFKVELLEILRKSKFGDYAWTPDQLFLKVLYEFFKDRSEEDLPAFRRLAVALAEFQSEGFRESVAIIERYGGVLVSDAVGLGKTYIGLALLEYYSTNLRYRGHVPQLLIVCPAQLRDLIWEKLPREYGIGGVTVISQEELGRGDWEGSRFSDYEVVLIDESHNFRNSATNRYSNLLNRILMAGRRKKVILLTATPVNNDILDLLHQFRLITRGDDGGFRAIGIPNLGEFFKQCRRNERDPQDLLEHLLVRRSRFDIKRRQEAGERVEINGQQIHFPERRLERIDYSLSEAYSGLYTEIIDLLDKLKLVAYNVERYSYSESDKEAAKRNEFTIALIKTLFLKRLESSVEAFANSVERMARFQEEFYERFTVDHVVLRSRDHRKLEAILERPDDELEETAEVNGKEVRLTRDQIVENVLSSCEPVDLVRYQREQMKRDLSHDREIFRRLVDIVVTVRASHILTGPSGKVRSDEKIDAFKRAYAKLIGKQKTLIFTYYQDTASYLYEAIVNDPKFLGEAGLTRDEVGIITGATEIGRAGPEQANPTGATRNDLMLRFAPLSNLKDAASRERFSKHPIQLLISTDVLSEGQNLQDAAEVLNFDLHWNPVRMIQRAGRIDRIGNPHPTIRVTNVFPDKELESLLNLVQRLQDRISQIDATVGLDASVLGEVISQKTFEQLRLIRAKDRKVVEDLEREADFATLDEMRLPLVTFLKSVGEETLRRIPLGVHSGFAAAGRGPKGVFFAFRHRVKEARPDHHWLWWPIINPPHAEGDEVWIPDTGDALPVREKRRIFGLIQPPDRAERALPSHNIIPLLSRSVDLLVDYLNQELEAAALARTPSALNSRLVRVLQSAEPGAIPGEELEAVLTVLRQMSLEPFRRDKRSTLRRALSEFEGTRDVPTLSRNLFAFALSQDWISPDGKARKVEATSRPTAGREDLELIGYLVVS